MSKALRIYRFLNILSLDVVAGALACAVFFAHIFNVQIKINGIISLALSVWIIYTTDHLLDAKKVNRNAATERHRFHQKNFKVLQSLLLIAIIADAFQLFFIRKQVLIGGVLLVLIIVSYFFLQQHLRYLKELIAAFLYSGGVLLVPISLRTEPLTPGLILLVLQFFITALINLLLFSWFDYEYDEQDHHQSFPIVFGAKATQNSLTILFIINTMLAAMQFYYYQYMMLPTLIILGMNLVLLLIFKKKDYFSIEDRYRLLGDAVFLTPIFYILYQR